MYVCLSVCVCLHNSGTAGPIWLNLFLLAPSWSRDGFRPEDNMLLLSAIIFGDLPHENSNIFAKIFYDYFGGKSVFSDFQKNRIPDPELFLPKTIS